MKSAPTTVRAIRRQRDENLEREPGKAIHWRTCVNCLCVRLLVDGQRVCEWCFKELEAER